MNDVSVIIPTIHDRRIYKAIETLKNQDCEIIIVQNGTENPWRELQYFCVTNNMKFIHFKEGNLSKAYNVGSKVAKGDIIVHTDSDTYFSQTFIEDVKRYAKKGWITKGGHVFDDFGEKKAIGSQAWFLYKNDFEMVGGYDEEFVKQYATDVAFCFKARQKGIKNQIIPHAVFYHPSTAHKRGFNVGVDEAQVNKKYPGYQKTWRMVGADGLEILRIVRHLFGLVIGRIK